MHSILRKIDLIILAAIAITGVILSALGFFGLLKQSADYSFFTFMLLAVIGLHLIISHFTHEDSRKRTDDLFQIIHESLRLVDIGIITFKESTEIETYLGNRILEAQKSVCDLSWKAKISEGFSAGDRQLAHTFMDQCIKQASERISYREIFIFSDPRRVEKMERRLSEQKDGYSCGYFKDYCVIPRLQFVIVDDEEVFFFASASDSVLCAVRNPDLCKVFRSYYDAAWNAATPIKTGPTIHHKEVKTIIEHKMSLLNKADGPT